MALDFEGFDVRVQLQRVCLTASVSCSIYIKAALWGMRSVA